MSKASAELLEDIWYEDSEAMGNETKFFQQLLIRDIEDDGETIVAQSLCIVGEGPGRNQRIGNSILIKHVVVNASVLLPQKTFSDPILWTDGTAMVKIALCLDKDFYDRSPDPKVRPWADLTEPALNVYDGQWKEDLIPERYEVLALEEFRLKPPICPAYFNVSTELPVILSGQDQKSFSWVIKDLNAVIRYKSTGSTINDLAGTNLYIIAVGKYSTHKCNVVGSSMIYYSDRIL